MPVAHAARGRGAGRSAMLAAKQEAEADLKQAQKELADKQGAVHRAASRRARGAGARQAGAGQAQARQRRGRLQRRTRAATEDVGQGRGRGLHRSRRAREPAQAHQRRDREPTRQEAQAATRARRRRRSVATAVVALETEWARLNREVADARERFQSLQDKEFKASMVESAAATGAHGADGHHRSGVRADARGAARPLDARWRWGWPRRW